MAVRVELKIGDVLQEAGDVLIVKHTHSLRGLDAAVVQGF